MMDEKSFNKYLRKAGRSETAAARCVNAVHVLEEFLSKGSDMPLADMTVQELDEFVRWADSASEPKTKTYLWGLIYYFDSISNSELKEHSSKLRQERIVRKAFVLSRFRGVSPEYCLKLKSIGIVNVEEMLARGMTKKQRELLAKETGIPVSAILEFVKLSDLSRIQGIKGIRARLYVDFGVDTIEKLAGSDPEILREDLVNFVNDTHFDGIPPLPAELRSAVATAKKLPKIVE